ncbi:hypothetical protein Zm00014a_007903 [Zea mays]|uniref:Uncharacterized protein n=1 Tax=Zea mays TaxID=4577 RepID=A0A3L6EJI7_MAIZE|nr:hypothetical protein Zm00014a_007903 [Zea mays]
MILLPLNLFAVQQRTFIEEKCCSSAGHWRDKSARFYGIFLSMRFTPQNFKVHRHIDVRANMSLPVSPCSSPLRQLKQSNWSCVASPSHLAFSSGSVAHNTVSYMQNQMRGSDPVPDPWRDISHRPQSPYDSPKRF